MRHSGMQVLFFRISTHGQSQLGHLLRSWGKLMNCFGTLTKKPGFFFIWFLFALTNLLIWNTQWYTEMFRVYMETKISVIYWKLTIVCIYIGQYFSSAFYFLTVVYRQYNFRVCYCMKSSFLYSTLYCNYKSFSGLVHKWQYKVFPLDGSNHQSSKRADYCFICYWIEIRTWSSLLILLYSFVQW